MDPSQHQSSRLQPGISPAENMHYHSHDHASGHGHSHGLGGHPHSHEQHSHDHGGHHSHQSGGNHSEDQEQDRLIREQMGLAADDDVHEEVLHFHKIIKAFSQYKNSAMYANHRRRTDFFKIPAYQQKLMPRYLGRLEEIDRAIEANYEIIKVICEDQQIFVNEDRPMMLNGDDRVKNAAALRVREQDMEKVQGTIKQFVRDWSVQGLDEREAIYHPIVQELHRRFEHVPVEQRHRLHVLVPGSGLGRLAFDIANAGYSSQGNEFSYYMLLASNFILNKTSTTEQYTIYPFVHTFSNIVKPEDVMASVKIPDVNPNALPRGVDFSMVAGDFVEVYNEPENHEKFDAIVTCFFIDTAKNIADYLQTIHKVLKKGGIWINAGPLLWHFENTPGEISIELSLEEVLELARELGFRIETQGMAKSTYMANPHGMLKYVYECSTWTATKL
ncbi:hypothetical protein DFQ26_006805 [Actinomortierella ambigua]|nr:hypothetical protein DFQ26_006805 [Actinomortierella ambigua]